MYVNHWHISITIGWGVMEDWADDRYDRQPRVMGATVLSDSTADLGMGLHVDEPIALDSNPGV
jgi:hypothetical protein